MAKEQIGWVARRKQNPQHFAGHNARCKVYGSRGVAIAGVIATMGLNSWRLKLSKDEQVARVLNEWDVVPAFIEVPQESVQ